MSRPIVAAADVGVTAPGTLLAPLARMFPLLTALLACAEASGAPRPHTRAAAGARDAVVAGDLERYRRDIAQLRRAFPRAPYREDPAQQAVLDAIARAETASTLDEAASSVATIAVACGGCHAGHQVDVAPSPPEPAGDGVYQAMARHDRALGMVWDGLIGPSQANLDAAADAFARSALRGELAAQASTIASTRDPAVRAGAFGTLLLACVRCHESPPPALIAEPR